MIREVKANNRKGDLYPSMRRVISYCRWLTCAPMKLDDKKDLQVSQIGNCIVTIITAFQAYGVVLLGLSILNDFSSDNPYQILSRIQYLEKAVHILTLLYQWRRHSTKLKNVFERIKAIDGVLEPSKDQERHFFRKTTEWIVSFTIGYILHVVTRKGGLRDPSELKGSFFYHVKSYFNLTWLTIHGMLPDILFYMLLTLCCYYSENLNRELKRIFEPVHIVEGTNSGWKQGERVRELREALRQIDLMTDEIDEIFGYRLAISMLHIFVDFVYFIFIYLTLARYFRGSITSEMTMHMIHNNVWMAIHCYRFFEALKHGSKFARNGRKISISIHELLTQEMDDNPKKELAIFSLILLHRKNEIPGKGFDLDYTFIPTFFSATAVHIMVLLQFNMPGYENGIEPFEDLIVKL